MSPQRRIPPLVSAGWLQTAIGDPGLIVVDIRSGEEYGKGHAPGSVNMPFGSWITEKDGLMLEVPPDEELFAVMGRTGIGEDSAVVVVNRADTNFDRADAARVAWTLSIAGIRDTAVLDGGHNKWLGEGRPTATTMSLVEAGSYEGCVDRSDIVSREYVLSRIGKAVIADARSPEDFFGVTVADFAPRAGHIPTALSMPVPWLYNDDGTFKDGREVQAIAEGVVGKDRETEIIVYCGVGGFTSVWVFLLTQMLGYTNVRFYDGSMQDWSADPRTPVSSYTWR